MPVAAEDMEEAEVEGLLMTNNNRSLSKRQTSVLQEAMVAEDRVVDMEVDRVVDMEVDLQLEETAKVAKRFK